MNKPLHDFLIHLANERNYSPRTVESYRQDIEKFYRFLLKEDIKADDVDLMIIRNFLTEELINGVSKRSCKRRICALKHYYSYLLKNKIIDFNPFNYVVSPKVKTKYPTALDDKQIQLLLSENKKRTDEMMIRDQAIIEVLYYSGVRASELVNIKMSDVNFRSRYIHILGKGNKERLVPFTTDCLDTLNKYIKELRPTLVARNEQIPVHLFLNSRGEQLTTRGLEFILNSVEDKTGLNLGLHPHLLRHTFATHLLENGANLRVIQELLGHESINATQVYTHVTEQNMRNEYLRSHPRAKK